MGDMRSTYLILAGILSLLTGAVVAGGFFPTAHLGVIIGLTVLFAVGFMGLFILTINVIMRDVHTTDKK